ncbi:MAG: PSD1 and planctomycete cytochrome C domain-containing protein [Planctomycetaceae bacterium]|nr:PSD1 and planctomycete cytochrome C domain-containing protein [Planctomycetaceae bacterium]
MNRLCLIILLCRFTLAPLNGEERQKVRTVDPTLEQVEFFEKNIRPLLVKHCHECHSSKEANDNGELDLESLAGIARGGFRGKLWDDNNPDKSLLIEVVSFKNPDLQMPPEGKLSQLEIELLSGWIRMGSSLPEYQAEPVPEGASIDYLQVRQFWSVRPLTKPPLPKVKQTERVKTAIDRFIFERLEEEQFTLRPEADRQTLIRRLTFDLTGLPPTSEEVEQYLADESTDAYEKLVERLLESPHYGERWARFWLDLTRYTDTTASWLKSTGQAWLYRDWVISAFNRNLPYDEFVRLQLAADLIPETTPKDYAALGMLGLSPTYWKELKLAPDVIRKVVAEEWDERVDAVSRTFLGMTISCARCHDHKFDPITMQDYYSLAGVFASTQLDDRPLLPDAEAEIVQQAHGKVTILEEKIKKIKQKDSPEVSELNQQINEIKQNTPHYDSQWVNIVKEASVYVRPQGADATRLEYKNDQPRDLPIFRRGNPANPGEIVPRGFPVLFSGTEQRRQFKQGSGRQELSDALFSDSQALIARVFVNRIWAEHFGQGIVQTRSNFGKQGEKPSHPKLLDWLAGEFIRSGWDIKWLHRQIVSSSTYRQASTFAENAFHRDPENRLLWRMNRRRLTIEMWRDSMLAVSGNLDSSLGGPPGDLEGPDDNRRTIYGLIARRELNQMLRIYDFPEPTAHSPKRVSTTTPLQQLFVLNSPFVEKQAESLLQLLPVNQSTTEKIQFCYRRLFAREPTADEVQVGLKFLAGANAERWTSYLHALLSLNEFLYVD